jgi:uncharacterized membrane protein YphA (DoxX/SURF4 family)
MGLYRILVGILAFTNQALLFPQWRTWFTEQGFVPRWLSERYTLSSIDLYGVQVPRVNVFAWSPSPEWTLFLFVLSLVCAFLMTIGLWTRWVTVILAVLVVSMHHRNAMILHGGDVVLRLSIIYCAMSACGASCSVDRLRRLWRGEESGPPPEIGMWPQRFVTANLAYIYFTTTWLKYGGTLWKDGTATYYPVRLSEFSRFWVPPFMNELPMVKVTTYGTLATEFAMATLVFYRPWRKYALTAGLLMHGFIEYSMNIPLFSFLMVSAYVCFFEGEEVTAWVKRWSERLRRFRTAMGAGAGQVWQPGPHQALRAMDPFDLVELRDGAPEPKPGAYAARAMGSWWWAWVPGLPGWVLRRALTQSGHA